MSCWVYILRSEKNGDIYIGSSEDVENRFKRHNSGLVRSTKTKVERKIRPGGEVVTLRSAKPLRAGAIPAQASGGYGVSLSRFARSRGAGQNRYARVQFPPRPP